MRGSTTVNQFPPRGIPKASKSVAGGKRYTRFKASMVMHSGTNPEGSYMSFLNKDPIRNIDVIRDDAPIKGTEPVKDWSFMKGKVPAGTQTFIYQTGKLDKTGALDRTNIEAKQIPRNKTDHVTFEPPQSNRPQQRVFDLMMTKPRYTQMF